MFTVERVTLREIRLRLVEPFRISSGEVHDRRILLTELTGSDGSSRQTAWGECVAGERPNYSPETIDTSWLILRDVLVPRLLAGTFEHPREVSPALDDNVRGHRMAKASLEMACWDLAARLAEQPLAKLLGGERERVETGISLGLQPTVAELADKARQALDEGYRKIKIKIKPGADLEPLRAVREALGPSVAMACDANAAYSLADAEHLARLDEVGMIMLEQPLDSEDLLRHARLQQRLTTPLCLDESITSVDRAEDMIEASAGRIVNIKPGRVGGFTPSLAIHDVCRRSGIPVWCGGMLESGVGRSHNVALASLPNFKLPGDLSPSRRYWAQDVVTPEWTMSDEGWVSVPWDRPGSGVDVDKQRIESLTHRSEVLTRQQSAAGSVTQ